MKRVSLLLIGLFLVAELLLGSGLWRLYRNETHHLLQLHAAELEGSYAGVVTSFRQLVEVTQAQSVEVPDVLALLRQAAAAGAADPPDESALRRARGLLYRRLYPTYDLLRRHDVRGMQIVLPDGTSLLRVHRPDLVGDDIAAQRPLLRRVLDTGEPGQAFEGGRVYPGIHYAFPVHAHGRLLAVLDYNVSFDAVRRSLGRARRESSASRFLLGRALLDELAHPSARALFEPVRLHPDYVTESGDTNLHDTHRPPPPPAWVEQLDARLSGDARVRQAFDLGLRRSLHLCLDLETCYSIVLQPVDDSAGRVGGFLVSYVEHKNLATMRLQLGTAFGAGSLLLLLAVFTLRRWLSSRTRLRTVSDHMGEGLYVMDRDGRILHANAAAGELLGYTERDLKGCDAHALLHVHGKDDTPAAHGCPVRTVPLAGRLFRSDQETFRRSDGSTLTVSVVASPLKEEQRIVGIVVLFRDVTAEMQAKARLLRADVAFRNMAEAVVVTDADARIQAVNAAFTQITGYTEDEVLGENPRLLASGRQDRPFYGRMWQRILTLGSWEGEIWNRRKSGEIYPEWLKITAVRNAEGRLEGFVSVFSDTTELHAKEERLRHLAYHDQLTGHRNRNAFMEMLSKGLARAQRMGGRLALLYLDIDRFKRINDTLGHDRGDALLRVVARRLAATLRPEDVSARIGGDEYAILLYDANRRGTPSRIAESVLAAVREPIELDGQQVHMTASIGISLFPDDGSDAITLLKHADAAMYLAKQQGRDCCRWFTAAMASEAEQRFALEAALRRALDGDPLQQDGVPPCRRAMRPAPSWPGPPGGRLQLFYQPKVSLADGAVLGLEALLRWHHPTLGLLTPDVFLDIAREAGLMQSITEWVLQEAARQCRVWQVAGLCLGRISVNLDIGPYQMTQPLEALLLGTVRAAQIDPQSLELEILETEMHADAETGLLWERLVAAGFALSIDDFGTGESSLARLKRLPVTTLKIDRSLVDDIEHDDGRAIVRTIIAMTKTLGKQSVAEGVETAAQLRFLSLAGCDAVQGYFFCEPMPAERIEPILRQGFAQRLAATAHPPDASVMRARAGLEPPAPASPGDGGDPRQLRTGSVD